ncbi:MAG TPA: cyclase family protein [Planctomycetota bacterium]|nr:cyclase family protein [Planctomycetota bacterium]
MKIYDISIALRPDMAVWPGDPAFEAEPACSIAAGAHCNVTKLRMTSHTGTHVDAPLHFIDGAAGVDSIDLHRLVAPAEVLDCTGMRSVTAATLRGRIKPDVIPLLKTDASAMPDGQPFREDYVPLGEDAARYLAETGVKAVGIDYLSVAPFKDGVPVHRTLLGAGIIAIEGLRLAAVPPGRYTLVCLPLKITGCDGAPARVILIDDLKM